MAGVRAPKCGAKTPSQEPLLTGKVDLRVLPKATGKYTPQGAAGTGWSYPPGSPGAHSPFVLSCFHFLQLPTALADTLRWTAVFRLEYFIQENLTWQSDSHVGAVCSMSSLGPTLAMSLRGAGW